MSSGGSAGRGSSGTDGALRCYVGEGDCGGLDDGGEDRGGLAAGISSRRCESEGNRGGLGDRGKLNSGRLRGGTLNSRGLTDPGAGGRALGALRGDIGEGDCGGLDDGGEDRSGLAASIGCCRGESEGDRGRLSDRGELNSGRLRGGTLDSRGLTDPGAGGRAFGALRGDIGEGDCGGLNDSGENCGRLATGIGGRRGECESDGGRFGDGGERDGGRLGSGAGRGLRLSDKNRSSHAARIASELEEDNDDQ